MLDKGVWFLQDNAPAHNSLITVNKIRDLEFELLEHPSHSLDLTPSDWYLFPQRKRSSKGRKL